MLTDVIAKLDIARAMTAELQTDYRKAKAVRSREYSTRAQANYKASFPGRYRAIHSTSTARRRAQMGCSVEALPFIAFLYANQVRCPYCLEDLADTGSSIDHIRPLSKGGTHEPNNLILCCKSCNSIKHNRTDWPPRYHYFKRTLRHLICDDFM